MDGSIVLGSSERMRLLQIYRGKEETPAEIRLRAGDDHQAVRGLGRYASAHAERPVTA